MDMNSITYQSFFTPTGSEHELVITAIVTDGRACGAYEYSRSYFIGKEATNIEDALAKFIAHLANTGKQLHAREYEGV